jgi:hypothetical protein
VGVKVVMLVFSYVKAGMIIYRILNGLVILLSFIIIEEGTILGRGEFYFTSLGF